MSLDRRIASAETTLLESRASYDRVDYLLRIGLASDLARIAYYRRAIASPSKFVNDATLRPYGAEMFATLLKIVLTDTQVWNRVKTILTKRRQNGKGLREEISDSGLRSLVEKSVEHEVPLPTILEVYSRGCEAGGERSGFGRVNSFLAGGKARQLDADLLGEEVAAVEEPKPTLSKIKRILKEKRQ